MISRKASSQKAAKGKADKQHTARYSSGGQGAHAGK
jgi:hypothetical protein